MDAPLPPSRWAWCPDYNEAGEPCRLVVEIMADWWVESTSGPVHMFTLECLVHRRFQAEAWQVFEMP